ncbi:aldehyde dehydrogenase (NADP(+)) [Zobellella endophytica]|uniref:2,5-dioxovalerate dehydrogenase n=1 Tax=Zobellella endophytica TaxID=2116700 RepID=A0A2P7QXB6_9GAMM|nr:aldehyde dehydrogenase (NADP(+)) [Zobellella endophytica]PSJ42603.1 aldehyde dehydrogenase (NADP(+)) [Zobellella endophytica]
MSLTAQLLLGSRQASGEAAAIYGINPATNERLEPGYPGASPAQVAEACALAETAFEPYRHSAPAARAAFLEAIAAQILALGDALIERAMLETGLPRARLEGERGRTIGQLLLFAEVVRAGDWLGVRIDPAQPQRTPLPRADLRLQHLPLGPVAVFGASNFPLAFSVAGGDTASALAAGCPVVVKAHSAHPGTSELVGRAVVAAALESGMPDGVFSLLYGSGNSVGQALAADPHIKAVGFTGSRQGGQALLATAQARREPIPVYAEMSSINPVLLLPAALANRTDTLAAGFAGSLQLGAGQFCTNPGLILGLDSPALNRFAELAAEALTRAEPQTMLTPGIHQAYREGVDALSRAEGVESLGSGPEDARPNGCQPRLFRTSATHFLADEQLQQEVFGASALLVSCRDETELAAVLDTLEGQLTATVQMDDQDGALARRLLPRLERKAGRVLFNGFPTGVEVCHAMVHGGPWPATSDSRTTSVGSAAIQRFLRPVCYQDCPPGLLPEALQDDNPWHLRRLQDGRYSS